MKMKSLFIRRFFVHFASLCAMLSATLSLKAETFNAKDYGAVGDDKTDNTAAFSKCMEAIVAAGGGKMFLPDGIYRGRIAIPPVSKPMPSWITIEIVGESEPTPVFGTIGSFPQRNHGCILNCLEPSGPAVITATRSDNQHGFSIAQLNIENPGPGQTDDGNEWQKIASDINDPDNLGIADVNWWVVRGNVGAVDEFKVTDNLNALPWCSFPMYKGNPWL